MGKARLLLQIRLCADRRDFREERFRHLNVADGDRVRVEHALDRTCRVYLSALPTLAASLRLSEPKQAEQKLENECLFKRDVELAACNILNSWIFPSCLSEVYDSFTNCSHSRILTAIAEGVEHSETTTYRCLVTWANVAESKKLSLECQRCFTIP